MFATLGCECIDDMNEDLRTLAGCRSEVHGAPRVLHGASTRSAEMERLVSVMRSLLDDGVQPGQVGLAARSSVLVEEAVAPLAASGIRPSHLRSVQRRMVRWRLRRCLLFAACTRARENLVVSWHGTPSPLLQT
jgi:hypothetical protein